MQATSFGVAFFFAFYVASSLKAVEWDEFVTLCKKAFMALTNNDILKKLRVALKLRDDDIVEILQLADFRISKGEIGNFCRKEDHPKYVELQDQILRNFLNGLIIQKRGPREDKRDKVRIPDADTKGNA